MLAELGAQQALVRDTFAEASEALGYDLWALVQNGPEERLNQTDKTQPAILTVSIALWRLWLAEGGARPAFVAGHSLGEYSALVAAESLAFADAVKLVERRGQLMQQAVPAGRRHGRDRWPGRRRCIGGLCRGGPGRGGQRGQLQRAGAGSDRRCRGCR